MNKLLSAEFLRLFKSLIFKMCLLFSGGLGVFMVLMRWWDVKKHSAEYAKLGVEYSNADGLIFVGGLYLIFAIAVFISVFVGTEYSDGTIRNKLIAGHTRSSIYFSKFVVCAVADIMIHILCIVVVLILGNLLINGTTMTIKEIVAFTMVSTIIMLALTAFLLLLTMSIQSKAVGAIVCLLVVFIMMVSALSIEQRLEAPEYYDAYSYPDEDTGEMISVDKEKNPKYLSGTKREVYEFLNNFIPVSQLYQIVRNISDNVNVIMIYDCLIIIITTGVGIAIFKKKDLK